MTEGNFMQLLVIALMLMLSGKNANIKELKPIFEEMGGDGAAAFKQAEELSGMITAVQSLMPVMQQSGGGKAGCSVNGGACEVTADADGGEWSHGGFPLEPIANIADERITYCLSRYIALGE